MVTKELIKAEIDNVQEQYLEPLYRIIKAFERSSAQKSLAPFGHTDWHKFIAETYGSFADDSIEPIEQGEFEVREEFE